MIHQLNFRLTSLASPSPTSPFHLRHLHGYHPESGCQLRPHCQHEWLVLQTYELTNLLITLSLGFESNIYILYILYI